MKKQQIGKRGLGLMALALSIACSLVGGRTAMAQTVDPEAEGNVVIEVNNTDTAEDDVLRTGNSLPCNARLTSAGKDMTVVLVIPPISSTNSAKRLSFSNTSALSTITLTLNKDGSRSYFNIWATNGSEAVNDAKIEAHKDTATGTLKTTGAASVYWFKSPHMFVTQGGAYNLDNLSQPTTYSASPTAVYLRAELQLMPQGLPTSGTPELASMGVGIVQNDLGGQFSNTTVTYGNPQFSWLATAQQGDFVTYKTRRSVINTVPYKSNDTTGPAPLYNSPSYVSDGVVTADDNPTKNNIALNESVVLSSNGHPSAAVTYTSIISVSVSGSWLDWCVICDMDNHSVKQLLRENSWSLNANSTLPDQRASVGSDGPVTDSPNLDTSVSSNDLIKDPRNRTYSDSGTTMTLTKR